jgi:lipopolysaccharide export system permease protein
VKICSTLKRLDSYLIRAFIPPFLLAFFIALFVLIMQILWLYIDDILGKGTGIFVVIEFLMYLSMSLVPMALPIGVLLASVMVFGNLGERYELSSFKSAGISLVRIMLPLIIFCSLIACFSWVASEQIIPYSNLKFKSRLYDMRKQKPTLNLDEKIFNEDFQGYTLRIGKKAADGRHIEDVMIYDHRQTSGDAYNMVRAERGEMFTTADKKQFIMRLYDGVAYRNDFQQSGKKRTMPFTRTYFSAYTKVFDLTQFELSRTDEELFRSNQTMKNSKSLKLSVDSLTRELSLQREKMSYEYDKMIGDSKADTASGRWADERRGENNEEYLRYIRLIPQRQDTPVIGSPSQFYAYYKKEDMLDLFPRAISQAKNTIDRVESMEYSVNRLTEKRTKHIYELHMKYAFAVACLIFLFIGGPMGAIVRKGGFGYPLLVSVGFFVSFILLTTFCKKLAESGSLSAILAAWMPVLIFLPLGTFLTYKAVNDSRFLDWDRLSHWLRRVLGKEKHVEAETDMEV